MRAEERKRKGEQVEAGKACEKGERGKEDSISPEKQKNGVGRVGWGGENAVKCVRRVCEPERELKSCKNFVN